MENVIFVSHSFDSLAYALLALAAAKKLSLVALVNRRKKAWFSKIVPDSFPSS